MKSILTKNSIGICACPEFLLWNLRDALWPLACVSSPSSFIKEENYRGTHWRSFINSKPKQVMWLVRLDPFRSCLLWLSNEFYCLWAILFCPCFAALSLALQTYLNLRKRECGPWSSYPELALTVYLIYIFVWRHRLMLLTVSSISWVEVLCGGPSKLLLEKCTVILLFPPSKVLEGSTFIIRLGISGAPVTTMTAIVQQTYYSACSLCLSYLLIILTKRFKSLYPGSILYSYAGKELNSALRVHQQNLSGKVWYVKISTPVQFLDVRIPPPPSPTPLKFLWVCCASSQQDQSCDLFLTEGKWSLKPKLCCSFLWTLWLLCIPPVGSEVPMPGLTGKTSRKL